MDDVAATRAEYLFHQSWESLCSAAWAVRRERHIGDLAFAVPGGKRCTSDYYPNTPYRFASISLTGAIAT
ncbi:MAG TPA: hypothetical protein ENN19_09985 [Chloroflexi bacterium]|nr:hypothetical protein [Chloroflexota bacterium]